MISPRSWCYVLVCWYISIHFSSLIAIWIFNFEFCLIRFKFFVCQKSVTFSKEPVDEAAPAKALQHKLGDAKEATCVGASATTETNAKEDTKETTQGDQKKITKLRNRRDYVTNEFGVAFGDVVYRVIYFCTLRVLVSSRWFQIV